MRGARVGLKAGAWLLASAGAGGGQLGHGAGAGPGGEGNGLRAGEGKERVGRAGEGESWAGLLGWVWFGFSYFVFLSSFLFQTPLKSI